jgi:hypothetical protein
LKLVLHSLFIFVAAGEEGNDENVAKDDFVEDDHNGSDSASVTSGISEKDVTMPTLESLEPESNG